MNNKNDKKKAVELFIPPEKCPVCSQVTGRAIRCKKCGLYFFRYYEKKEMLDNESAYFAFNLRPSINWYYISYIFLLFTISIITVLLVINDTCPVKIYGYGNNLDTMGKITSGNVSNQKTVNIYQESSKRNTGVQSMSMDIVQSLYKGRDLFYEGVSLYEQKRYSESAEKFKLALKILEKCKHNESIALTNLNIAVCCYTMKRYDESLSYFENALHLSRLNHNKEIEARALQGRSLVLKKIGAV